MQTMCTREVTLSPPLKRIKRGIEQLKFYQPVEKELPAEVSFTIDKLHYGIYRIFQVESGDTPYIISYNFDGGCSQSVKSVRNLDLDDLFTYLEQLDIASAKDIKFRPPAKLYDWLDLMLHSKGYQYGNDA